MHFFVPANKMKLLEIIRGEQTADEVLATVMKLAKKLNKIGVVVNSGFGFVGNRIFLPYLQEAQLMLIQGTPAEKIDQVAYDWGFAMGPLEAMDLSGLDVFHSIYQQLADEPGKYAYYPVSEYLYNNSRLGKKNDSGFYHYQDDHKSPDPEVMILAKQVADDYEIKPRELTDEDIINRLVMAMVSEASYILQEKIASRPSDIDVIMVNGYGFPRYRGGAMCYADTIGLDTVYQSIIDYNGQYPKGIWTPSSLLENMAKSGETFYND
jgi:3-hydroxyacyl-CoA dehydrogenase